MLARRETKVEEIIIGRGEHDRDLIEFLTDVADERQIDMGLITLIGAVKKAKLLYYRQDEKKYHPVPERDGPFEIISGVGNISLKDGARFVHLHLALSDHDGALIGGHADSGTIIFALEYSIAKLSAEKLERGFDPQTGLMLWRS